MAKGQRAIIVGATLICASALCVVIGGAYCAVRALVMISALTEDGTLLDLNHRSVETVGQFSDSIAQSNFKFVTDGLRLVIPDGTIMDQHDNAWDRIVCCFQFDSGAVMPQFPSTMFTKSETSKVADVLFLNLSDGNQVVPTDATKYDARIVGDPYTKIVYLHPKTDRIWVYYGYRPPMD